LLHERVVRGRDGHRPLLDPVERQGVQHARRSRAVLVEGDEHPLGVEDDLGSELPVLEEDGVAWVAPAKLSRG
jgi:hypothetical protein